LCADDDKVWKEDIPGKNEHVPQIAKKLRPAKKLGAAAENS
jgi:hypothetical protein